jgi:hypothetical protein
MNPPKDQKPKKYSFTKPEFMYVSEHRAINQTHQAMMQTIMKQVYDLHDALIKRYVGLVVLDRLKIDGKDKFIQVNNEGTGIDVYDNPPTVDSPPTDKVKTASGK